MEQETKKLPDLYINTGKGTILAIIKLLEALVAGYGLYYIFTNPQALHKIMNDLFTNLEVNSQSAFASTYQLLTNSIQYILAFVLLLIVLDGLGAFFLRTTHKGAGLVRFCHMVRYIFTVVGFIASIAIYVQYIINVVKVTQAAKQFNIGDYFAFLGSFELIIDVIILLGVFWLLVTYDRYVARVTKQVKIETKAGEIQPFKKKNPLGREAAWLGGIIAASVVLSIVEVVAGDSAISAVASFIKPVGILRGASAISIAVSAVVAIKFFLVSRCSADFDRAH